MIEIALNMICIALSAWLWGAGALYILTNFRGARAKNGNAFLLGVGTEIDLSIVAGLCVLTVYAEFFSLFYKVSGLAFCVVVFVDFIVLLCFRKEIIPYMKEVFSKKHFGKALVILFLAVIVLILANQPTTHYDTDLYHAQSIRWIEEYGIVPGLGNLHNRFAYNSAFFPLQALYSWRFLVGHSLHAMNAFVFLFFLAYAICSAKVYRFKKFFASDFLRIGMIAFMNYSLTISSPETDHMALGLVIYVLIKWVELWEEKSDNIEKYSILCLLALFAVSVKLSTGMTVLLVVYPASKLIGQRNWTAIVKYIVTGFIILVPFFARNVFISGYLVYPYPEIDIFDVDWKMPSYTLWFDRYEIRAWGQGLNDVNRFRAGLDEWFPTWFAGLGKSLQRMFVLSLLCAAGGIIFGIRDIYRNRDINFIVIIGTMIASLCLWFSGAPLLRYGMCYIIMLPLFLLGYMASTSGRRWNFSAIAVIVMVSIGAYQIHPILSAGVNTESKILGKSPDYNAFECSSMLLGNLEIFSPVAGDQSGYHSFPATPYPARLELIEMRGESVDDGFRMKEEYRNQFVSTYGEIANVNMFDEK